MIFSSQILGSIAVAISFLGYVYYFKGIFKGEVKPHIYSWVVWSLLMGVACLAQLSDGAGPGAWVTGFEACAVFLVMIFSFRIGTKDITLSDKISLSFALLTIPLWLITNNPLWSVILICLIDAFGFYPTFRKGYSKPWDDGITVYMAGFTQFLIALFALENFSLITALYPISLILSNGSFVLMILTRRRFIPREGLA